MRHTPIHLCLTLAIFQGLLAARAESATEDCSEALNPYTLEVTQRYSQDYFIVLSLECLTTGLRVNLSIPVEHFGDFNGIPNLEYMCRNPSGQTIHGNNILDQVAKTEPDLQLFVPVSNLTHGAVCDLSGCHSYDWYYTYYGYQTVNFTESNCTIPAEVPKTSFIAASVESTSHLLSPTSLDTLHLYLSTPELHPSPSVNTSPTKPEDAGTSESCTPLWLGAVLGLISLPITIISCLVCALMIAIRKYHRKRRAATEDFRPAHCGIAATKMDPHYNPCHDTEQVLNEFVSCESIFAKREYDDEGKLCLPEGSGDTVVVGEAESTVENKMDTQIVDTETNMSDEAPKPNKGSPDSCLPCRSGSM